MKNKLKKDLIKNESGQSLVEFALILPILIILLSMVVDVWRVYDTKLLLQSVASECAIHLAEKDDVHKLRNKEVELKQNLNELIDKQYGNRLDRKKRDITVSLANDEIKEEFTYHVNNNSYYLKNRPDYEQTKLIIKKYKDASITVTYDVDFWMPLTSLFYGDSKAKVSSEITTRLSEGDGNAK
ncbi:TadE/TadG family type IV pilus assembly protein [Helcococcus ovis]|uniref:TadE/TadG family type IV pilus assembly protein n=1 Tax=Helcococcus ovis TaxID=72026 RepID=UPI0038BA1957